MISLKFQPQNAQHIQTMVSLTQLHSVQAGYTQTIMHSKEKINHSNHAYQSKHDSHTSSESISEVSEAHSWGFLIISSSEESKWRLASTRMAKMVILTVFKFTCAITLLKEKRKYCCYLTFLKSVCILYKLHKRQRNYDMFYLIQP